MVKSSCQGIEFVKERKNGVVIHIIKDGQLTKSFVHRDESISRGKLDTIIPVVKQILKRKTW